MGRVTPRAPEVRFRVDPAYAGDEKVARRMGLTAVRFRAVLGPLLARGFPAPDETTGLYDLEAVDRWRKRQLPDLYPELMLPAPAVESPPAQSMGAAFRDARGQTKERQRRGRPSSVR